MEAPHSPIVESTTVTADLRSRYPDIEIRDYALRRLYSTEQRVFLDCEGERRRCLTEALTGTGHPRFVVYSVTEDGTGRRTLLDVSYANIGRETLEKFIRRYPEQLKPAAEMALQLSGSKYLEYVGASYE